MPRRYYFVPVLPNFWLLESSLRAINAHLRADFIGLVMFSFSFILRKLLFPSSFLQWPICHLVACWFIFIFFSLRIFYFISWSDKILDVAWIILHLLRLTLCPKVWSILRLSHWGAKKNMYSLVFEWSILYMRTGLQLWYFRLLNKPV